MLPDEMPSWHEAGAQVLVPRHRFCLMMRRPDAFRPPRVGSGGAALNSFAGKVWGIWNGEGGGTRCPRVLLKPAANWRVRKIVNYLSISVSAAYPLQQPLGD